MNAIVTAERLSRAKHHFIETAYKKLSDFPYRKALFPVEWKDGGGIGGAAVYPEVNVALPVMLITQRSGFGGREPRPDVDAPVPMGNDEEI